nr:hypothetical protein CFP56_36267 [Quercus suber]
MSPNALTKEITVVLYSVQTCPGFDTVSCGSRCRTPSHPHGVRYVVDSPYQGSDIIYAATNPEYYWPSGCLDLLRHFESNSLWNTGRFWICLTGAFGRCENGSNVSDFHATTTKNKHARGVSGTRTTNCKPCLGHNSGTNACSKIRLYSYKLPKIRSSPLATAEYSAISPRCSLELCQLVMFDVLLKSSAPCVDKRGKCPRYITASGSA